MPGRSGRMTKPTKDTPVGIMMEIDPERGPIVTGIKAGSILAETNLLVGVKLISFNGLSFEGMNLKQAIGLFRTASGTCMLQTRVIGPAFDSIEC